MKLTICDVCYPKGKYSPAKYRTGTRSIKVDLCKEHKDDFSGMTTADFVKKATDLFIEQDNFRLKQ